jgi:spore coat protein CotF
MAPNTTTNTNSRKVTTKVDDKKTKVSKKTKVVSTKTSTKTTNRAGTRISTKTNTRISTKTTITVEKTIKKTTTTTTTETETINETPQCRAFYKFSNTPTTEWASALRDLYYKGIVLLRGPHNAFGYPINMGFQPCGCRVSWGIVNRRIYSSLSPRK